MEHFPQARRRLCRSPSQGVAECKGEPLNQQRIEAEKAAQGVTEDVQTWHGWQTLGYEVIHGSKALFGVDLIWGSRGDGATYKARFFGASQVQPIAEAVSA